MATLIGIVLSLLLGIASLLLNSYQSWMAYQTVFACQLHRLHRQVFPWPSLALDVDLPTQVGSTTSSQRSTKYIQPFWSFPLPWPFYQRFWDQDTGSPWSGRRACRYTSSLESIRFRSHSGQPGHHVSIFILLRPTSLLPLSFILYCRVCLLKSS